MFTVVCGGVGNGDEVRVMWMRMGQILWGQLGMGINYCRHAAF